MSELAKETPLVELLRSVPKELRAEWPCQWAEDNTPTGHAYSPIGEHCHGAADQIEKLEAENKQLKKLLEAADSAHERLRYAAEAVTHHLQWYVEEDGVVQIDPEPLRQLDKALKGEEE